MTGVSIPLSIRNSTAVLFLDHLRRKFRDIRGPQIAGSLSFTTLLSIVPLLTVILLVTSRFQAFAHVGKSARLFLLHNLLPDRAGRVITVYALQFSQKASSLTLLGTLMLLVTAVMLLQTIDHTFNSIWNVRQPRPWFVRIPAYLLVLTLGPVLFGLGAYITTLAISSSLGLVNEPRWVARLAYQSGSALMLSALFAFLFHAVPNRHLVKWHSIVGGLIAGCGVVLVQRLFGIYLTRLPSFTLIYGTFSVLPIFLVWLHATWLMVLFGATVAAALPEFESYLATRRPGGMTEASAVEVVPEPGEDLAIVEPVPPSTPGGMRTG